MTMGRTRGMGPVHYQRHKINKCEEFHRVTCKPDIDKCCAVIRCTYCLSLQLYGETEATVSTLTTEDGITWAGTVADLVVEITLERDYVDDKCRLVVIVNGEEVDRVRLCEQQYDGTAVTCRDLSHSLTVTTMYSAGTLSWYPFTKRRLPYRIDPDTNCKTWFCGECECACKSFCVSVFNPLGSSDPYSPQQLVYGQISDLSYSDCDGPVWIGDIEGYRVSFELYPNEYGRCMASVSVDGVEPDAQEIAFCEDINLTFELYNGIIVTIQCATCDGCPENPVSCCSCQDGYSGCLSYTATDPCVDKTTVIWSELGSGGTSPYTWGSISCEFWSNPETYALSMAGCEYANRATSFRIFMIEDPSEFAISVGADKCDWVCEVYSDGAFFTYILEYARVCQGTGSGSRSVLDWVQFYNVPIPFTTALVTLSLVRTLSTTDICVPDGRPGV